MNTSGVDMILRSIDLSLDRRKLTLALLGILASAIGSGIFTWLGARLDNFILTAIFGLMGVVVAWVIISLFAGAITRLSYSDLAGWPAASVGSALMEALQRLPSLLFAPLLLGLAVVGATVAEAVLMLFGRIPYLGELMVSVLFLPIVLINLLMFVIVLAGAWLVYPVAMGENAGVLQTLRRVIDVTRHSPGRILTYLAMTIALSLLLVVVLAALVLAAYFLTLTLTVAGMSPQRAVQMGLGNLLSMLGPLMGPMGSLMNSSYGGLFGGAFVKAPPITMSIAGALMGLETLVLWLGSLWAVPWVFNLTASCAVFQSVSGATPMPQPAPVPTTPAWSPAPAYGAPAQPYAASPTPPVQSPYHAPQAVRVPMPPPQPYTPPSPPPAPQVYTPSPYSPAPVAHAQPADEVPTLVTPPKPPPTTPIPPSPSVAGPAVSAAPRLCRSCGKPLAKPDSRFCQVCGAKQF